MTGERFSKATLEPSERRNVGRAALRRVPNPCSEEEEEKDIRNKLNIRVHK